MSVPEIFLARSRYWLVKEYPIKLRHCVNALPRSAVWARPNQSSNSIGNLLVHLTGNVTEWILGDLQPYVRDTLSEDRLREHGFFRPERVRALVDRLYQPGADYTDVNHVMGLIVFQEWYDLYMR